MSAHLLPVGVIHVSTPGPVGVICVGTPGAGWGLVHARAQVRKVVAQVRECSSTYGSAVVHKRVSTCASLKYLRKCVSAYVRKYASAQVLAQVRKYVTTQVRKYLCGCVSAQVVAQLLEQVHE